MLNEEKIVEKLNEMDKKIDLIYQFLEDAFLTQEEKELIKDTDKIVKNKKNNELISLDDL